jgi:ferrous iron transport protein B
VILGLSILLWFLQAYPKSDVAERGFAERETVLSARVEAAPEESPEKAAAEAELKSVEQHHRAEALERSYAGRIGRAIEPSIRPLGFDWRIGIGLVASFAAREVLVSTLAIVFNVEEGDDQTSLQGALVAAVDPSTGRPAYRPLTAVSLLVFFVLACQCISTLAVIRRETASWRWPLFALGYMTALAYAGSFAVFRLGEAMGY